jgi:hypothetical protein
MWKKEQVNQLVELYDSNISLSEISIILDKSEISIYKKLKRINKFNGRNSFWTKDEESKLKKLIEDGIYISEISKEMNRTKYSIEKKIKRLGLLCNNETYKKTKKKENFIDWIKIQELYNSGKTYKDIIKDFNLTPQKIQKAQKEGNLILRDQKEAYQQSIKSGKRKIKTKDIENNYRDYRELCSFKFNLDDFKEEFDFGIIEKYGWYKAKNNGDNPNGVSRDHKVSVKYGFENKINPEVISHPANCQLMQQFKNSKKGRKISISIDELMNDINIWNEKYQDKKIHD